MDILFSVVANLEIQITPKREYGKKYGIPRHLEMWSEFCLIATLKYVRSLRDHERGSCEVA